MSNFKEGERVVYTGKGKFTTTERLVGKAGLVLAVFGDVAEVLFDNGAGLYNVLTENLAPEEPRFYAGQAVRCLQDNDPGIEFTAGDLYEVEWFEDGRWPRVHVVEDDSGDPNGMGAQFFEPYEPEPTTPAPAARDAIVCVLDDFGYPLPATRPYVHANRAAAEKESVRLAEKNPGKQFTVFEAVSIAYAPPPPPQPKPVATSVAL